MIDVPIRILVAEFIPAFNKGELAILNGMLRSFETLGKVEVAVYSFYPEIDRTRYPKEITIVDVGHDLYSKKLFDRSKVHNELAILFAALQHLMFMCLHRILGRKALKVMDRSLWKIYCDYDVFIVCSDEVDCVNGSTLRFSPIYISWLGKVLRKPVVFYGNGTTKFKSEIWIWRLHTRRLWRILARYVLSLVSLVTVRDEGTYRHFRELCGNRVSLYLTADPAFLLAPANPETVRKIMLDEKIEKRKGRLVGVAMTYDVLSEACKFGQNPTTRYRKAVKEISVLLDRLVEKFDAIIVFVPHSIEPYDYRDDRIIAKDISQLMTNKHMTRVITNEYSAEELKGLLGELDLLLSCRVHCAISALSMGTPSCIITRSWDKRAYNIIGKMVKQEKWICSVEDLDADKLFTLVADIIDSTTEIRKELRTIIGSVTEKALLNGRLLKVLLDSRSKTVT